MFLVVLVIGAGVLCHVMYVNITFFKNSKLLAGYHRYLESYGALLVMKFNL